MKLDKIKTGKELPVGQKLLDAKAHFVDGSLRSVELIFTDSKVIHVSFNSYSELLVATNAPPKLVDRYRVSAVFKGIDLSKHFEHKHEADAYHGDLETLNQPDMVVARSIIKVDEDYIDAIVVPASKNDKIPF